MKKAIARLQKQLNEGKITKREYQNQLSELLDDEVITQDEHDEVSDYEPEGEKPEFTQSEVNNMVVRETSKRIRTILKQAGVEVNVPNKELSAKLVELLTDKGGEGANEDKDSPEYKKLVAKAARVDALEKQLRDSAIENSILKAADKYNPVNVAQVVRALNADYSDLLDFDDEKGIVTPESMKSAMKQLHKSEPNLFKQSRGDDHEEYEEDEDEDTEGRNGSSYGRQPSYQGSRQKKDENATSEQRLREMLNLNKDRK